MHPRQVLAAAGQFNLQRAKEASAERNANDVVPRNLRRRQKDFALMVEKGKIGDGHRDATGYTKPGSNKK